MFLGAHTLRRTRYLNHAARVLARLNCAVHIAPPEPAAGETSSFLADSRWPLLEQTKVVINLHCGEQTRLEWRRVLDAIHAGAVVVTEHSSGIAPLEAGEHLLVASADSLPFVAESLVRDSERLAALRTAAYERLSEWIPFALPVAVLRAAIVELVGEPVPPDVSLGTPRSAAARAPSPPATDGSWAPSPTDARDGDAPRVTVVAAIAGATSGEVEATLDSVAEGAMRDVELVIVGGAGTEPGDRHCQRLDGGHPGLAARLVPAGAGASLGAARNAGLAAARAPLCLLLDAGHALYPRGLGVLADALDVDPGAAFAYPIQEVIGDPDRFAEAGGDYLLSFLGWEAQRLRHGNYIHAPVLIRTDVCERSEASAPTTRSMASRTTTSGAGSWIVAAGVCSCPRCSRDGRSQGAPRFWRRCIRRRGPRPAHLPSGRRACSPGRSRRLSSGAARSRRGRCGSWGCSRGRGCGCWAQVLRSRQRVGRSLVVGSGPVVRRRASGTMTVRSPWSPARRQ